MDKQQQSAEEIAEDTQQQPSEEIAEETRTGALPPITAETTPEGFWDEVYRRRDAPWSGDPNAFLVATVAGRTPGTALELGAGDGGDAIWLAGQGWQVTAVDISAIALERATRRAAAAGVADRFAAARHDLARTFPAGRFDLVASLYTHSALDFPRTQILRRAAEAVAPGGTLLIVEHASSAPWMWDQGPDHRWPTPEETLASLDLPPADWRIARCEAPSRIMNGPAGQTATVLDNVIVVGRVGE